MTTCSDEQHRTSYAARLAALPAGPAAPEHTGDAIVQFCGPILEDMRRRQGECSAPQSQPFPVENLVSILETVAMRLLRQGETQHRRKGAMRRRQVAMRRHRQGEMRRHRQDVMPRHRRVERPWTVARRLRLGERAPMGG